MTRGFFLFDFLAAITTECLPGGQGETFSPNDFKLVTHNLLSMTGKTAHSIVESLRVYSHESGML